MTQPEKCAECQFERGRFGSYSYESHSQACSKWKQVDYLKDREEVTVPQQSSGIEEIVAEFEDFYPNAMFIQQGGQDILKWLKTNLTSFETRIRADEADKCNEHIEKAVAAERTRIADLIEERLGRIERLRSSPMVTKGQMDMARATLEELRDVIKEGYAK